MASQGGILPRHRVSACSRVSTSVRDSLDSQREPICQAGSNRLEAPRGSRAGQYSIRINAQWRICFRWTDDGPSDVEIVDYH